MTTSSGPMLENSVKPAIVEVADDLVEDKDGIAGSNGGMGARR